MRMLWLSGLLGCVVASTANAQPAGNAGEAPGAVAPSAAAPPSAAQSPAAAPPSAAPPPAAPPPSAAPSTSLPDGPPGLTAPCTLPSTPGPGCASPQSAPGVLPLTTPTLVIESEPDLDYRWQIVTADGLGLVVVVVGGKTGATVGGLSYLLASPIIHIAHDEGGRGAASLALRLGLPIVGAIGVAALTTHKCAADDDDCDDGSLGGAILGFGLGVLGAMVIDTALLARPVKAHKTTTTWVPQVTATAQHVGFGVAGRF